MAARVSRLAPPAAQAAPDQETREQGLKALRLELETETDPALKALLLHEIARLHERREDLAAAARDELAATKLSVSFVEPIESLVDIATRSRSRTNLTKLLERLQKVARTSDEQLRSALSLALTHFSGEDYGAARTSLERALEFAPQENVLWIALETVAAKEGDHVLLLKATTGRAAYAGSVEMRCLLLERLARLQVTLNQNEAAFDSLRQSVDELPTWRTLHTWEELALKTEAFAEAGRAAVQTATILRAGLEDADEAQLYQIPPDELSEERAIAAHVRSIFYAVRRGDWSEARSLADQLSEASPESPLALALLFELCRSQDDPDAALAVAQRLLAARKWRRDELAVLQCLATLAARKSGRAEEATESLAQLRKTDPESKLPQLQTWLDAERADDLNPLVELLTTLASTGGTSASALELARAFTQIIAGNISDARRALIARSENGALKGVSAHLLHLAAQLSGPLPSGPEGAAPPLSSLVKGDNDKVALAWEELRTAVLAGNFDAARELPVSRDSWVSLALVLLAEDRQGTDAPLTSEGEQSRSEAQIAFTAASQGGDLDAKDLSASTFGEEAKLGDNDSQDDAVVASLTERTPAPDSAGLGNLSDVGVETTFVIDDSPPHKAITPAQTDREPASQTRNASAQTAAHQALLQFLREEDISDELRRALVAHLLARTGDAAALRREWENSPSDPLLSGALLEQLEKRNSPELEKVRKRAAAELDDDELGAAWLLKSTFSLLTAGKTVEAHDTLASAHGTGEAALSVLDGWFKYRLAKGEPRSTVAALKDKSHNFERHLEEAALLRRWEPEEWAALEPKDPPEPLQVLRVLDRATRAGDELDYALDETELFTAQERAILALSRTYTLNESADLSMAARRWAHSTPAVAAQVLHWVAGQRSSDLSVQGEVLSKLDKELNSDSLLAAIPTRHLSETEKRQNREKLKTRRDEKGDATGCLSWALVEQIADEISSEHAEHFKRLGEALDPELNDPDAQATWLVAGFQYLVLGHYETALEYFERLLQVIPGDLTLCEGARIAAQQVGRVDIEAPCACEIAKSAADNEKSANLWERAGVLYDDFLGDRTEAEKCFIAALVRRPGSRVAFERIYRYARDRNDRQRQVELIDARLYSAQSESLQLELYWEKARFCRILGRRTIALRALEALLKLDANHLPALALSAELHLVDGRIDAAAESLRAVAVHPDTPGAERAAAGMHACDLFEQLRRPRDAVDLLQILDGYGITGSAGLDRKARSLARSGDWGEAYVAFHKLNGEQDTIETRLESARMMLAIQRDHLRDPEELKASARCVLRDAPDDPDAVAIILSHNFSEEEKRRLLEPARKQSRISLRKSPLNPPEIAHFAELAAHCGDNHLERVALGNLGLTGRLSDDRRDRLTHFFEAGPFLPSSPWSKADLEAMADPLQLGSAGKYIKLVSPYLAEELDPSLDALGVSSLMRTDEFSGSPHRAEVGTWVGAFGDNDFELYVGGTDPGCVRGMHGELPTILLGRDVSVPLTHVDRARLVSQLAALHYDTVTFLNHPAEVLEKWMLATEIVAGRGSNSETAGEIDEMARRLAKRIPREVRDQMAQLREELSRAGVSIDKAPYAVMRGSARAAVVAHGDASILRQLGELLPSNQEMLNVAMTDIVRFVLTDEFAVLRRKAGLGGA